MIRKSKSRIDVLVRRVSLAIARLEIALIVRGSIDQTKGLAAQHNKTIIQEPQQQQRHCNRINPLLSLLIALQRETTLVRLDAHATNAPLRGAIGPDGQM